MNEKNTRDQKNSPTASSALCPKKWPINNVLTTLMHVGKTTNSPQHTTGHTKSTNSKTSLRLPRPSTDDAARSNHGRPRVVESVIDPASPPFGSANGSRPPRKRKQIDARPSRLSKDPSRYVSAILGALFDPRQQVHTANNYNVKMTDRTQLWTHRDS